jgi:hypothetical protein
MVELAPCVRVKCVADTDGCWIDRSGASFSDPKLGDVLVIADVDQEWFLQFAPYGSFLAFDRRWFVPLEGNEDMADLIAALDRGVEHAIDVKVPKPAYVARAGVFDVSGVL